MASENTIILTAQPRGVFCEGHILTGQTPSPGTVMQIDYDTGEDDNGRWTWRPFNYGADGTRAPIWVLLEERSLGRLPTTAFAAGDHCRLYAPVMGEELNMLLKDVGGTTDDHAIGEVLIVDDTTGKLIATTGSPESEPFILLETVTDPTADTLARCMYTGY